MKTLKERWLDALKDWRWWFIVIFITLCIWAQYAHTSKIILVHENSGMTHTEGGIGPCFGWKTADRAMRVCYLDRERTSCKDLILSHDVWHEGTAYPCWPDVEPEEDCYDENDSLEQCEGG
jgi:hypothetical protein